MLSLFLSSQKSLSQDSVQRIFELLKINPTPDVTNFLNDPDERDFYAFFFGVLVENRVPCALDIDWKWHPEDLLWQLERYFTSHTIKLTSSELLSTEESYRVEYEFDGKSEVATVAFDSPDQLLDSLSQHLKDTIFIAINFFEDRYSWLIVPKDFNIKLFCSLTDLTTERPKLEPANFAKGYKQTEKLFFKPTLFYVDKDGTGYTMPGQTWAGRVLPGQTIEEGIAAELKAELDYTGRFDYSYDGFEGVFKDRKGQGIKRYRVTVYLYDKTFQNTDNATITLEKIPNKTFPHPAG